jgi:hypothetical protein
VPAQTTAPLSSTVRPMRARLLSILRWSLLVWGAISLLAVVAAAFFTLGPGNRDSVGKADVDDVRFVLNWSGLGEGRAERVVNSYQSARSPGGDYLDAYAIKITHVEVAELLALDQNGQQKWYRGDKLPPVVDSAVEFSASWGELTWFPPLAELRSSKMYVLAWSITFHGTTPSASELIFVRPADNMVFYVGSKT